MKMKFGNKQAKQMDQSCEFEVCVLCGKRTDVPKSQPIELRIGYVEGAGQLCHNCWVENVQEDRKAIRRGLRLDESEQEK